MRKRSAQRLSPFIHFCSQLLHHVGIVGGAVGGFTDVSANVVELGVIKKTVQAPICGANDVFVVPGPVVAFNRTGCTITQRGPDVFSIKRARLWHLQTSHRHQSRKQILGAAQSLPLACSDTGFRPVDHCWQPRTSLVDGVLATAQRQVAALMSRAVVA